ncbi:MAG: molybdenum cofactor biosynthesis protein MoaE [Pseudomonadales bacterium]|nr:molybdenum cofactor biosynthesis protein MoaE [Pseudomonadales bacterium]
MKIAVQREDFDLQEETAALRSRSQGIGAIVTFSGLVRDWHGDSGDSKVASLFLEHYPGMTEKSLRAIATEAEERWPVLDGTIIHRIGELAAGEQIVLVAVCSAHRQAAFAACEFIMDYLKTRAPFWKKTRDERGEHWVDARESDVSALDKWKIQGSAE